MDHRPTTRVLAALELLQTHRRLTGAELARRLDVSVRTVRRYIAALESIGVPITAEQGRDGAYMLVAGFKLPPMMFTDEEAFALSVGLLAARELGIVDGREAADSAQAKLLRVLPDPIRQRLGDVDATIRLDLSTGTGTAGTLTLGKLSAAARRRRRVHVRYDSPASRVTSRDLDPYGLSFRGGRWYVVGLCHLRKDMRTFRLDRMLDVVELDERFERPDGFDVLDFLGRSFRSIQRAHAVEVLLRTDLATAKEQWIARFCFLEPADSGVLLKTRIDRVDEFAGMLASLPCEFEVRQPAALDGALRDLAARLERCASGARG